METSKLISKIKISHLPCYLSDNESASTPLYTDSITFHEFKQLNYQNFKLESSNPSAQEISPSLQYADCSSMAKIPDITSTVMLDRRTLVSKLGRTIRKYLQGEMLSQTAMKRKVKCVSMERITPEDLSLFYRYKSSAKQVKKMCDINLGLLLEKAKELFRTSKKDSIQTLLEDLSRLIVNFVSASDSDLHFNKCKYILDRLEELENIIHDRFNIKYLSKDSIALTILQIPSLKTMNSAPSTEDSLTSKTTLESSGKTPSLRSLTTNAASTPKTPPVSSESGDQSSYKQVLNLIAQAKYTMAQMGHLLHYDRLANPDVEQFYPKNFKKKWECAVIPSPPGCRGRKRTVTQTFASFSTALDVNLASIDLDTEKPQPSFSEINTTEDLSHCSNLMRFFYCNQAFLEDFEDNVVKKRKESLGKYCLWKIKKWAIKYKKEIVVKKYQHSEVTCKMCAHKVKIDKLKEHSDICKDIAELNRELKDMEMKLGEALSDTFMRSKESRTQLLVMKNEYQRLKKKNCSKSVQGSTSIQNSLHIRHLKKMSSTKSGDSLEENDNTSAVMVHGSNTTREEHENEWEGKDDFEDRKRGRKLTLPEGTRIKINLNPNCQESLNFLDNSFGQKLENDNEIEYVSPGLPDNQKSFVEKVLEKYPQKYEGSPAADRYQSPAGSNKTLKRMQSLTEKKRFAELIVKSKSSISQFYSDQKTETGSEPDLDSERNMTDDDKVKDKVGQDQYSSEGSDALRLSVDMTSSEKSQCNSPDVSKTGKLNTVYKKSKFYLGNGLNFDKEEEEQKELEDKKTIAGFEPEDEEEEEKRFMSCLDQKRGGRHRRTTVFFKRNEGMGEVIFGQVDKEMLEELTALKKRIDNTRYAYEMYEIIKSKGKIMLNQEAYKKDMEKIKDDIVKEIDTMKKRIKDQDIITFADNFISALEKRIQVGKKVQEAQKSLDLLDGKIVEEPIDQKKFSLIRGHSSLTLTKKRLGFSSTPVTLPNATNNSEEPFSLFKSINLNSLKARSSHNTKKTFNEFNETGLTNANKSQPSQSPFDLQLNEKVKRLGEESLPELQEETEELVSVNRGDISPFGVTNFDHSFQAEKEEKRHTERKISGVAPFSLDELIANSPREPAIKSENIDSKFTQISLVTDDSSPITGTQNTIKEGICSQKEVSSKNLTIICGNEEIEEKEEERKSPETPSFEAPLIWRTSTAPARTLSKLHTNHKDTKNDIADMVKRLRRGESGEAGDVECNGNFSNAVSMASSFSHDGPNKLSSKLRLMTGNKIPAYEEGEEQESEDKTPPSNLKSRRLLQRLQTQENPGLNHSNLFRQVSREDESFDDEVSPGRQLNRVLHGITSRRFIEDSIDEVDNEKIKEESPHIFGSPLIQRGYYSDTHVKKVHRTLSKQSLIGINDFELITMISKGAYGRVWLVRRKATNDIYAMKEINLGEKLCKNPKELESLRKENKIFGLAKEDFVVRAVFTFIHETYICFVMEYMLGGDFGDILYNYCALEEEVVRFYIAEIVLALEYLHSLGIVHRDLKPDNILLDKHGHAKLTDFGLSETGLCKKMAAGQYNDAGSPSMYQKKEQAINKLCRNMSDLDKNIDLKVKGKVMPRRSILKDASIEIEVEKEQREQKLKKPHRLIGTPDYMAPEIILGQSLTNYSIDWWSLGVMLFEFLCGTPPFNDETPDKIYDNITKLKIPWDEIEIGYGENCMSPEAADLVKKLLTLDPSKRLGANGADDIKKHPFFKGIDWEKLRTQQAPIIPEQKNEIDTSNFVRLGDELKKKDQENPFNFVPKEKNAANRQVAKEWLEAASENFSIFNYSALYSDNLRVAEEALKQKERELKEFAYQEPERTGRKRIYDDIFDMPN